MTITTSISISQDLRDELTRRAQAEDRSRSRVIARALRLYLTTDASDGKPQPAKARVKPAVTTLAGGG